MSSRSHLSAWRMVAFFFGACLLAVSTVGCDPSSGTGTDVVRLKASSAETIVYRGKAVPCGQVGGRLKAAGVKPATRIEVILQSGAQSADLVGLTRSLAAAGFRKVVFIRERHAEAYATDPWPTRSR